MLRRVSGTPANPGLSRWSGDQHRCRSGIIGGVTSIGLENLARTAYEAHRGVNPGSLPPWEDTSEQEQQAWKAAVSAVAGQTGVTLADVEAVPAQTLLVQAGDERHTFHGDFVAGRQGRLAGGDEFAEFGKEPPALGCGQAAPFALKRSLGNSGIRRWLQTPIRV